MSRIWGKSKQNKGDKGENSAQSYQSNVLIEDCVGFFAIKA